MKNIDYPICSVCEKKIQDEIAEANKPKAKEIDEEEIRGVLAQGYCSKENEDKVLDPVLLKEQAKAIYSYLTRR